MSGATLDLETLPFPVAYPLSYARDEALTASERVDNVLFGGYQAVRTTTLLLLADYLESETACRQVSESIRGLRLPHWKEWVELCTALAQFWSGNYPEARPERETRFPELVRAWLEERYPKRQRDEEPWRSLLKDLPGGRGPARGPVDALWEARNRRAHGSGTRTGDTSRDEKLLLRLLPVLERMTEALFGGGEFRLLRKVGEEPDGTLRVIRLHGPHRDRLFEIEALGVGWASAFQATGIVALAGNEAVAIHPLFLPHDPEQTLAPGDSGGFLEDLYLLDLVSEREVVSLGVLEPWKLTAHLAADVTAALRRKQVDFGLDEKATTRWTLADWSASTSGRLLAELTGRKYFPDFYLERTGVDEVVRRSLRLDRRFVTEESEKRGNALLLLGEAGSGKSSLLCRLVHDLLERNVEQEGEEEADSDRRHGQSKKRRGKGKGSSSLDEYLEKRGSGDVILFLQGAAAYSGDMGEGADALLCDAVVRQGGVITGRARPFISLEHFVKRLAQTARDDRNADRKVWIVMDALNEADRYRDLLGALDRFLPNVGEHPWLRLVVSIRSGAYFEMAEREKEALVHGGIVFRNDRHWAQFPSERQDPFGRKQDVPYLEIRPFTAGKEGAEAYRLRQEQGGERSSAIRYEDLPVGVKTLLLSPLHLHLFHETWLGKTRVPPDLDEIGLFDAFIRSLTEGIAGLEERLQELAEVMLRERKALLPVEVAEEWEERWRRGVGSVASRLAKLSPVEELVAASILMRPSEEGEGASRRLVGYRFSHQSLASAVLLRQLRTRLKGRELPAADELLVWAKEASGEATAGNEPFPELVEAVAAFVVAVTMSGDGAAVGGLLDMEEGTTLETLFAGSLRTYGPLRGAGTGPTEEGARFWSSLQSSITTTKSTPAPRAAWRFWATSKKKNESHSRGQRFVDVSFFAAYDLETRGYGVASLELLNLQSLILRESVLAQPDNFDKQWELAVSRSEVGRYLQMAGKTVEALQAAEESVRLLSHLASKKPQRLDVKRSLAMAMVKLSDLLGRNGEVSKAVELEKDSVGLMRKGVQADPSNLYAMNFLAISLETLGSSLVTNATSESGRPGRFDLENGSGVMSSWGMSPGKEGPRVSEALAYLREAVTLQRKLNEAKPGELNRRNDLSNSLNTLGHILAIAGIAGEAEEVLEETVAMKRALADEEPGRLSWKVGLASSLAKLSDVLGENDKDERSLAAAEASAAMSRENLAMAPGNLELKRQLVLCLSRLSDRLALGAMEAAARVSEERLSLSRELVVAAPDRLDWKRGLAASLNFHSSLLLTLGATESGLGLLRENVSQLRELVAGAPGRFDWKWDLVSSSRRLCNLVEGGRPTDEECDLRGLACSQIKQLVAVAPERADWRLALATSLNEYGDCLYGKGQMAEARERFEESLGLMRQLVEAEPARLGWKSDLAESLVRVSDLLWKSGEIQEAAAHASECLAVRRSLLETEPGSLDRLEDVGVAVNRLGALLRDSGSADESATLAEEDLAISRMLVGANPERLDWRRNLTISLERMSDLLENNGQTEEAARLVAESLGMTRDLVAAEPGRLDWKSDLTASLLRMSDFRASEGRGPEAEVLAEEAVASGRELVAVDPGNRNWREFLARSLNRLVDVRLLYGGCGAIQAVAEEGLALRRSIREENPNEPAADYSVVVGLNALIRVCVEAGEIRLALEYLSEAEALWRQLPELEREGPHGRLEEARMLALRARLEPVDPGATAWLEEAQRIVAAHGDVGGTLFKLACVRREIRLAEESVVAASDGEKG